MKYSIITLIWASIFLTGCTEVFESDISKEKVILLSPHDELVTSASNQVFWWEPVEYADRYQFQLVIPDFMQVQRLISDTIITTTKISFSLYSGQYQWRVKAINSAYYSDYSTNSLTIDSTYDLSGQAVILIKPLNLDTFNYLEVNFTWNQIFNATNYYIRFEKDQEVLVDSILDQTTYHYIMDGKQGAYSWRVRALNDISATPFSFSSFYLDTISPLVPIPLTPMNDSTYTDSVIYFNWIRDTSGGSRVFDSLYLYYETSGNLFMKYLCERNYLSATFQTGKYYWTVRSFDRAGNKSGFSLLRSFVISH